MKTTQLIYTDAPLMKHCDKVSHNTQREVTQPMINTFTVLLLSQLFCCCLAAQSDKKV